jgi:putative ABC transport system permease protein
MTVSPGYFHTMRIPVRAGREFTAADLAPGATVLVNEAFARAFWPGLDPIGRQVTLHKAVQGRPDFGEPLPGTVVGVVGDVHHFGLDTPAEPQVYVPFTRSVWGHMSLVVRTAVAPAGFLQTLSRAVRQVDPDIPMTLTGSTGSMSAVGTVDITSGLASRQFDAWLLGSFAASALLLAAIGRSWDHGRRFGRSGCHAPPCGAPVRGRRERSYDIRGGRGPTRARFARGELSPRAPGGAGRSDGGAAI